VHADQLGMAHEIKRLPTTYQVPRGCMRSKSIVSPVHRQHSIQLLSTSTRLSASNFRQIRLTNLHEKRKQLISEHERAGTHISLMKQQFVVTHTIRHTEILAWLHSWVYKHTLCQNAVSTKILLLFTLS